MTDKQRKGILGRLIDGAPRIVACHAVGLTRCEFAAYLEKNGFREAVEETEAAAVAAVENALYKGAMRALEDPRYFRFMAFYQERKAGWVRPAPENMGKSVQSVQSIPAPVGAQRAAPAENPHNSVQSVQSISAPVGAQRAAPSSIVAPLPTVAPSSTVAPSPAAAPAEKPHKSVQSVQSTGDGAFASDKPANLLTCEPATLGNTVRNVQPARSSVAFKPAGSPSTIPNLKAKIRETMDANRARHSY